MNYKDKIRNGGRFETTTKTKITTGHGTILKVTSYLNHDELSEEFWIQEEYRIRPACSICKKSCGCVCFNIDNSEAPYEDACVDLQRSWICDNPACHLESIKQNDPEYYHKLELQNRGNITLMGAQVFEDFTGNELDKGDFCEY